MERSTCDICERFIVWQDEGKWFCWFCDPSNTTAWKSVVPLLRNPVSSKSSSCEPDINFDIDDDFVLVESKGNLECTQDSNSENELRNRVLGSLIGFVISEAIGVSAKEGPAALHTERIGSQSGVSQLLMTLQCLINTADDSGGTQDDFSKRLAASSVQHCSLIRLVVDHPRFLQEPEKTAREVWDAKSLDGQKDDNSALARAVAAGVFFQGDFEVASEAAKALTTVTHNDPCCRHSGAAAALAASVALLLSRPRADAYGVANEAFEFAAAELHANAQEDEIYELHRHLFPADLEDLELTEIGHPAGVLKALGSGFYCLTSNRIQNPLSKADADHAGNLSAAESKHWLSVDDEELMSTPLILDAAVAGFGEALQAQMKEMEDRLLALAGGKSPPAGAQLPSSLPAFKPRPSAEVRQAAFQEQITMLALEGGSSEVNCAVAGALLGAHFGLDGLPPQWVGGLGSRQQELASLWETLRPFVIQ